MWQLLNDETKRVVKLGIKGDKMTEHSVISAEELLEKLASINGLRSKKMFGGHGLFHEDKMFGLIDSKGTAFLKVKKGKEEEYTSVGAHQHSRMPYYSIPDKVFNDPDLLSEWANVAIAMSK